MQWQRRLAALFVVVALAGCASVAAGPGQVLAVELGGAEISQPQPSSLGEKKTAGRPSSMKYSQMRFSNSAVPGQGVG